LFDVYGTFFRYAILHRLGCSEQNALNYFHLPSSIIIYYPFSMRLECISVGGFPSPRYPQNVCARKKEVFWRKKKCPFKHPPRPTRASYKKRAKTDPARPSASPVPATWIAAAAPVDDGALLEPVSLVVEPAPVPVAPVVRLTVAALVLVLRLPAADVPATALELMTGTRVVFSPTGMPAAEDSNVAAGTWEVTTDGWVVTGRGCEVSAVGWPVTTPRESVSVT
jgi:hypothetical protein